MCLINITETYDENCLWIDGFGTEASSEDRNLFDGYRKSLNEIRSLYDAPFHIFTKDEARNIVSILSCVLYFSWDCFLISKSKGIFIRVSNDEIFDLAVQDESEFNRIKGIFFNYKLEIL